MISAGKNNVGILLTVGTVAFALPLVMGQETRPVRFEGTAPGAGGKILIDLSHSAAARLPGVTVLAGSTITITVSGKPNAECLWQFGYQDTVLAQKRLRLDAKGAGQFALVPPGVRSRAECKLMLISKGKKVCRCLTVFPSSRLAGSAKLIKACRFAVIDGSGKIQKTLKSEKVHFEDLSSRLLQDSFDGGAVFLSAFENSVFLNDACERLRGRIEKGMFAVIVNPPGNWSGWGVSRRRLTSPVKSGANFSGDFGRAVRPVDIGAGPWRSALYTEKHSSVPVWVANMSDWLLLFPIDGGRFSGLSFPASDIVLWTVRFALEAGKSWRMLAWIETVDKNEAGKQHRVKHPLISVRPVGRGAVIAVMLPQMTDPSTDAVGRAILDELVLWILKVRSGNFREKRS